MKAEGVLGVDLAAPGGDLTGFAVLARAQAGLAHLELLGHTVQRYQRELLAALARPAYFAAKPRSVAIPPRAQGRRGHRARVLAKVGNGCRIPKRWETRRKGRPVHAVVFRRPVPFPAVASPVSHPFVTRDTGEQRSQFAPLVDRLPACILTLPPEQRPNACRGCGGSNCMRHG